MFKGGMTHQEENAIHKAESQLNHNDLLDIIRNSMIARESDKQLDVWLNMLDKGATFVNSEKLAKHPYIQDYPDTNNYPADMVYAENNRRKNQKGDSQAFNDTQADQDIYESVRQDRQDGQDGQDRQDRQDRQDGQDGWNRKNVTLSPDAMSHTFNFTPPPWPPPQPPPQPIRVEEPDWKQNIKQAKRVRKVKEEAAKREHEAREEAAKREHEARKQARKQAEYQRYLPQQITDQRKHYNILGLQETATNEEIKKKYHKLARKYHPDVSKTDTGLQNFQELSNAYTAIKQSRSGL